MEEFIDAPSGASIFDDISNHVAEDAAPNGVGYDLPQDSEGHELPWPSFEMEAKDEPELEKPPDISVSKNDEGDPELGSNNIQDPLEDTETRTNGQDSNHSGLEEDSIITSGLPQRFRTIEVVLRPPPNPEVYHRIPPSRTVLRVVEADDESDDETFYTVEFKDGRIERATHDDICDYRGGRAAIEVYELPFNTASTAMAGKPGKRRRSEDEYETSDSDFGSRKRRRRPPTREGTRQAYQTTAGPDSESDESETRSHQPARSRRTVITFATTRVTRNRGSKKPSAAVNESEDELAQDHTRDSDDDDDDFFIVRSDVAPPKRGAKARKGKARPKRTQPFRRAGSDSSIGYEPARRSSRANKHTKSMKDPDMDEYNAVEERRTDAPKHVAVKEVYLELPEDSPFRRMHSDTCESCLAEAGGAKNPLINCQGCSFSYHKTCIGPRAAREHRVTKIGQDDFVLQCKFCIQVYKKKETRAPDHALCQCCRMPGLSCAEFSTKKTPKQEEKARMDNGGEDPITEVDTLLVNNADNVLFRCTNCKRGFHFGHLPALTSEVVEEQDVKENRLVEYSLAGWSCKDCIDTNFKIHALVAWRPLDPAAYQPGQTDREYGEDLIEYLIKWTGRSHFHDTWMPGAWVFGVAPGVMRHAFHKRDSSTFPKLDNSTAIEEEWLLADVLLNVKYRTRVLTSSKEKDLERIDEITSVFVKFQGLSYEEVVWDEPPSRESGAAWDAFVAAYDEYLNGKYFVALPDYKMRERIALYRSLDFGRDCELKSQPAQLRKGKLMEYQMEGVNFLLYNFHQQQNVILADEMGLGKTVQIVAFISALTHSKPCCWPFLVVVPNSTCPNWRRELKQWAPDLRVVAYHGGRAAQDLAYRHELYPDGPKSGLKAHVVIMSYEAAANVNSVFSGVKWVGLIVDEGQRLKNEETTLYKSLQDMRIPCRILLTGTPLQNNKRELFNLLQFIDSERNAEELDERYAELTKDNLPELHNLIRPYFLRRTKAQVLKFLPPMAQIILPVTMTVVQEKLSKSIMARNPELIRAIISRSKVKAGEKKSMNNILSDLRQCLCHPFCFNGEIEDKTVDAAQMHRNLVEASPKLLLFEIMLPKLKERGHRVLIFSQYLHSLTILEDFLTGMDMPHARIDGSLSALEKQKRIDAFNAPDSPLFVMLLSTRAGGVGINLATADTVIIYDPDFNPHQDLQALSRAHRIGQKRKVLCFQLMTKNTVEEKIMQMGRKKMALDHALIESMDAKEEASEDLEDILKHGAAALFSDESKDKITYDDASIEKLLDRSQIENTDTGDDDAAGTQFSFARVWANDRGDLANNVDGEVQDVSPDASTSIWENILKEREAQHERELAAKQQTYGRGARRRGTQGIDYKTNRPRDADSGGSDIDDDELYIDQNEIGDEDDSDDFRARGEASSMGPSKAKAPKGDQKVVNSVSEDPVRKSRVFSSSTTSKPLEAPPKPASKPAPTQTSTPKPMLPSSTQSQTIQHQAPRNTQFPVWRVPFPTGPIQHTVNVALQNPYPIPSRPQSLTVAPNPTNHILPPKARGPVTSHQQTTAPYGVRVSPPAIQLPNGDITPTGWIGGGSPCALCYHHHATVNPCVDLNSEMSLRLALDRLRASGNTPAAQAARAYFSQRLLVVAAHNQNRQYQTIT